MNVQPSHETGKLEIAGKSVTYTVKKSARAKRLTIKITRERRLEVIVPQRVDSVEAHRFIYAHRGWIEKKLHLLTPVTKTYLYLGKVYKLSHLHNREGSKHKISLEAETLSIESPFSSTIGPAEIFDQFLKFQGRKYLVARCEELAKQYDFPLTKVSIRGQRSRWGSCSRRGSISLNYKLMQFRYEMIDYVILHELCHLRHMNHSQRFWNEVGRYLPNYKALDKELNKFRL